MHNIRSTSIATWARMYSPICNHGIWSKSPKSWKLKTARNRCPTVPNCMVNSIVVLFFYRLQPITTDLISKMHEKSVALTLFSILCHRKGPPKVPKTSLTHETERQTDACGATITSYIYVCKNVGTVDSTYFCNLPRPTWTPVRWQTHTCGR